MVEGETLTSEPTGPRSHIALQCPLTADFPKTEAV
jgi:hypothetical protein